MILAYHSIDASGSVISLAPEAFRRHMEILARKGVPVVPLAAIQDTPDAVALTFDDGCRNFLKVAAPVLEEFRFPATVFVVSGYCGKHNDWPSQPAGIPKLALMDWEHLAEAANRGFELGAHTISHPRLTRLGPEEVRREMHMCKYDLEDRLGVAVESFAYPYGALNTEVRELAAKEFKRACGTRLDYLSASDDPWDLPRIDSYYVRNPLLFARLWDGAGRLYIGWRRHGRAIAAASS